MQLLLNQILSVKTRIEYISLFLFIVLLSYFLGPWGFVISIVIFMLSRRNLSIDDIEPTPFIPLPEPSDLLTVPLIMQEEYRVYLKSDEWKSLRREALKRDSHRCVRCGYVGILNVHHTDYSGIYTMDFTIDQLETVCADGYHSCHARIHRGELPMKKD